MKLNENNSVDDEFAKLFEMETYEEKIDHKAHMIMFRFLSEIEKQLDGKLTKKGISQLIGTSPSYITQLFRGDKLINLFTLAKFEDALNSEFDITLHKNSEQKASIENDHIINIIPSNLINEPKLTLVIGDKILEQFTDSQRMLA